MQAATLNPGEAKRSAHRLVTIVPGGMQPGTGWRCEASRCDTGGMNPTRSLPFGDLLPAEDPVAQFVASLAIASNDLRLTHKLMTLHPDVIGLTPGETLALHRDAFLHVWETHLLVDISTKNHPAVDAFVTDLGKNYSGPVTSGDDLVSALRGERAATQPQLRNVLRVARLTVAHYLKPGEQPLVDALKSLATEGRAAEVHYDDSVGSERSTFADVVAHRISVGTLVDAAWQDELQELSETILAIIHLADTAVALRYAAAQPGAVGPATTG